MDIDGTLRDECSGVPQSAYTAVRMCRERGIRILICTGRNLASIQEEILSMDTDGIIAGGGCLIAENGYVQKKRLFSKNRKQKRIQGIPVNKGTAFCHGVPGAYIHEQGCGSAA